MELKKKKKDQFVIIWAVTSQASTTIKMFMVRNKCLSVLKGQEQQTPAGLSCHYRDEYLCGGVWRRLH